MTLLTDYVLFRRIKLLCPLFELDLEIFEDWLQRKGRKSSTNDVRNSLYNEGETLNNN